MNTLANPGFKFILTFTFPSGKQYAAGEEGGNLTFVPIEEHGILRGVMAWASSDDVKTWLKHFKDHNGTDNWTKFKRLRPMMGQVKLAQ